MGQWEAIVKYFGYCWVQKNAIKPQSGLNFPKTTAEVVLHLCFKQTKKRGSGYIFLIHEFSLLWMDMIDRVTVNNAVPMTDMCI